MLKKVQITFRDWLKGEQKAGRFIPDSKPITVGQVLRSQESQRRCRI